MFGLKNSYSKFSYSLPIGLKPLSGAGSTPPFTSCSKNYGSNLAPLKADTITFSGRKSGKGNKSAKTLSDNVQARGTVPVFDNSSKNMSHTAYSLYKEMLPLAGEMHERAKNLEDLFRIKMCIFDCLLTDVGKKRNMKGSLASKEIRVKSTSSIAKKLASKVGELIEKNNYYDVKVTDTLAKQEIHDYLGAKLVLSTGSMAETNAVINQLIKSIESGNGPRIKAIKNYGKDHRYLSAAKLEALETVIAKAGYTHPKIMHRRKSSGYTATHIILEVANGIDAEIQILGRGVNRVKEIEDICYKGLQGKALKGLPEVSRELKKIGRDPERTLEFNKYLTQVYDLAKTKWDKMSDNELAAQKFPSIDTSKFPECLDLNNIEAALIRNKK